MNYWLMKTEPDEFLDRRPETQEDRAVERRAQLPGAQLHARRHAQAATACCSTIPVAPSPASSASPKCASLRLSRSDPVRSEERLFRCRQHAAMHRAGAGRRQVQAQAQARRSRLTNSSSIRELARLRPGAPRQSPVGAAGDAGAVGFRSCASNEAYTGRIPHDIAKKKNVSPRNRPSPTSRTAASSASAPASTVAHFIDELGKIRTRIDAAVSSSEQSTRPVARARHSRGRSQQRRRTGAVRRRRRRMRSAQVPDQGRRRRADAREDHRRGIAQSSSA